MRADADSILEMRGREPNTAPVELTADTMPVALFTTPTAPPPKPHKHAKRNHSSRITKGDDTRTRKNERTDLEAVTRASMIDEETSHMRDRELDAGA